MSGGLMVVAGVVGALALCETVLPRAFAALRKWRRERAGAKAAEKNADGDAPAAGRVAFSPPQPIPSADPLSGGCIPTGEAASDATLAPSDSGVARAEKEGQIPGVGVVAGSENAKIAHRERDLRSKEEKAADANRLWEEARGMTHRFVPDWKIDRDYLAKVYGAARLGHLEAMVKLGEYAARRGAVVEAYYWTLLAELKGATGLKVQLRNLRSRWQALGCPAQHHNTYGEFSEEQGVFARAVLRLQCGVNPQYARARLKELAERGVEEALAFLEKRNGTH